MAKITFKLLQQQLAQKGYEINKHPDIKSKNYIIKKIGNEDWIHIKVPNTLNEIAKMLTVESISAFIKQFKIGKYLPPKIEVKESSIAKVQSLASIEITNEVNPIDFSASLPKAFNSFYFPKFADNIVTRIKMGENIFVSGPTGSGKTEMIVRLSEFYNQKLVRVNFSIGTTEGHIIGKMLVKNKETVFSYGLLPLAMKQGWWILLDEIDYAEPEHLAAMQAVLEGSPLIITQNESEEIVPHSNFRVFATANTKGRGDETQSYTGTNILNLAFLDRFSIFEIDFTKEEETIIYNIVQDSILTNQIKDFFGLLRKAIVNEDLMNAVFSTRRMKQLARVLAAGESLQEAIEYELIARFEPSEQPQIREYAYDVWDREHYLKGWKLGNDHKIEEPVTESE